MLNDSLFANVQSIKVGVELLLNHIPPPSLAQELFVNVQLFKLGEEFVNPIPPAFLPAVLSENVQLSKVRPKVPTSEYSPPPSYTAEQFLIAQSVIIAIESPVR